MQQVLDHDEKLLRARRPPKPVRTRQRQSTPVTVHVIPHTHDDVGWLKTPDEYFTGAKPRAAIANVASILDSVVNELARDPKKTFTYVEMKFFYMWYQEQDQETKNTVKKLIKNGQLEVAQGGWAATDEACPNYEDMILNMHVGHSFLWKEFGTRPRVGWMLDAFGHSEGNAALFTDFGFEALFFARMNTDMRAQFQKEKKMTFLWEPLSSNVGSSNQILTHVFHANYGPPDDFNNEHISNSRDGIIPYADNINFNLDYRCVSLQNVVQDMADTVENDKNIMFLFGDDFMY